MKNKIINLIEDICESNIYIDNNEEYIIIPKEISEEILTDLRRKIIDLLREQNPIIEQELSDLFRKDVHEDLIVLNHLEIIKIQKVDSDQKHNIITLNKKVRILEPDLEDDEESSK